MTFKNTGTIDADEINNFSLLIEDEVVATVASIVNDFIVFNLAEPMLLEDQKTYDADVTADIIGGPAKTLILTVDSNLDIRAKDAVYGYGTGVLTTDFTANLRTVTVQAGELTITAIDAPNTDITDDRTDVVLGTVRVTTVTGQQLELQKLSFDFTNTLAAVLNTVFENIEVYLPSTGAVYSLTDRCCHNRYF